MTVWMPTSRPPFSQTVTTSPDLEASGAEQSTFEAIPPTMIVSMPWVLLLVVLIATYVPF